MTERLGKYEVLGRIGEGGFGVVYRGRDPFLKRAVAIKTCSSDTAALRQRFFREAQIAGNLHHPNVVTVHDFGLDGERVYLVQELLPGTDLDVLIRTGSPRLTLPTKLGYLHGIAQGLRYAHAQGVIHRDVKPGNVRVLPDERVKVMDFGIARLKDQTQQLTQTGTAVGTVAYMAPEQLRGEPVDLRIDIFSYGVLAYELCAGRRPFGADTVSTLFYQLLHEDPPPLAENLAPSGLSTLICRALEKDPARRFQTFDEILTELQGIAVSLGVRLETQAAPREHTPSSAGSGAVALRERIGVLLERGDDLAASMALHQARHELDPARFERDLGPLAKVLETRLSAASSPAMPRRAATVPAATTPESTEAKPPSAPGATEGTAVARRPRRRTAIVVTAILLAGAALGGTIASRWLDGRAALRAVEADALPAVLPPSSAQPGAVDDAPRGEPGDPGDPGDPGKVATTAPQAPPPAPPGPIRSSLERSEDSMPREREQPAPVAQPANDPPFAASDRALVAGENGGVVAAVDPPPSAPTPLEDRKPRPTTTSAPTGPSIDLDLIREQSAARSALAAFEAAWESRDHDALVAVFPGTPTTRRDLRRYRTVSIAIGGCNIEIHASEAMALCRTTITKIAKDGESEVEHYRGFRLLKGTGGWLIDAPLADAEAASTAGDTDGSAKR